MCVMIAEPHEVKARRLHRCGWCDKRIDVGESYLASTIVDDGVIYTWCECERCRPYVREMWESYGNRLNIPRTLTFADFEEYMTESHPEIWSEWMDESNREAG